MRFRKQLDRFFEEAFPSHRFSETTRQILEAEELRGEVITNRIRYPFGLLALGPTLAIVIEAAVPAGIAVNLSAFALYFGITLAHTVVLKRCDVRIRRFFRYLVVLMDVLVVTLIIAFWTVYKSPDAPAFALKNPSLYFFTLILIAPILQYRMKLVAATLGFVLLAYTGFVFWTWQVGFLPTNHWREYVMGEGLVVADVLFSRPVVFIGLAIATTFSIHQSLRMIARIGETEAKRAMLSRYFSPPVVEAITNTEAPVPTAQRQKVTVLFLDIRGFTDLCEQISEESLVAWLSDFRGEMTEAVFAHHGTLDKYIGDAVMATFGTPKPSPEPGLDSRNAVRCAKAMFVRLKRLNQRWEARGLPPVAIGIGLHTGEVIAGNIGKHLQIEYSVIGDPVNTASRIEGLCKTFERDLLVSQAVYEEVKLEFSGEAMPPTRVKGKREPLQLYAL
ncbi:MAG: adenylate/guanylate cyclase domain-containing protein [Opitutales bacterium]